MAAAVLLSGCVHRFECTVHGGAPVHRLETDHFNVIGDVGTERLSAEARRLELLWDTFAAYFEDDGRSERRIDVVIMHTGDPGEFVEDSGGFVRGDLRRVLVAAVSDEKGTHSSVAHEMAHVVSRSFLPRQPKWVSEGLATYLGDAEFISSDQVKMGRHQSFDTVLPLDTLLAWGTDGTPLGQAHSRYTSAWAYLFYLSNKDEPRLQRLFALLRTTRPEKEIHDELFPPDQRAALHAEVNAFIASGRFSGWTTRLLRTPSISPARLVEPWEVHVLRQDLLSSSEATKADEALLEQVAYWPPPAALAAARAEANRATAELSALAREHAESADALVAASRSLDLSQAQRIELLRKAVRLEPANATGQVRLARALLAREDAAGAEVAARKGKALAPGSLTAALLLAQTLAAQGKCVEALGELDSAISLMGEYAEEVPARLKRMRESLGLCGGQAP